jgi:coronin-1B/1C/6
VLPLNKPSRLTSSTPKVFVHKSTVLDFEFHPFVATLLATGSDDLTVKVTAIPENGPTENITSAAASMEGHEKKVQFVRWNPTANNILASAASDNTVRVWDVENSRQALAFTEFGDLPQSCEWNGDGSQLVTTCKDLHLRIFDPRDAKSVLKAPGFPGSKSSRAVWCDNHGKIAVVGFSKTSDRCYGLWDPKKFNEPICSTELDKQAGGMIPWYDPDTSMLYIGSKGGANIAYHEVTDTDPYLHTLAEYRDNQSQKGFCFLPKRACDAHIAEIAICMRLKQDSIIPISFRVPRKSDVFAKELFPDAYAGVAVTEAKDWLNGTNNPPKKISMNPKEKAAALASAGGGSSSAVEFKAAKTAVELQKELTAAQARIAELEAEVARLKLGS